MTTYEGVEIQLHTFLNSELDGGQQSTSPTERLYPLYPLDKRLGRFQCQSGHSEEKNQAPTGHQTLIHRSSRPQISHFAGLGTEFLNNKPLLRNIKLNSPGNISAKSVE
jgi:hypothetical protein